MIFIIIPTGTEKNISDQKGFGFIVQNDTNVEIFEHASGMIDKVNAEDKVSFEVIEDQRGKKANEVNKI